MNVFMHQNPSHGGGAVILILPPGLITTVLDKKNKAKFSKKNVGFQKFWIMFSYEKNVI